MQVAIFAFNKEGYQKEIARFDAQQLRRHETRVNVNTLDIIDAGGIAGMGVAIDPEEFPEMTRFVVKIVE